MVISQLSGEEHYLRLTAITEVRLKDHNFGVSELAREMGFSRTTLHRKVKGIFHCSASRYICHKRLEKACRLLQNKNFNITEVANECGFQSLTYFDTCFRMKYNLSPGEFRKRSY
jgi:AraC-like DNA-binding protein